MSDSESKNSPAAVISFEGQPEKLRACLHALASWVSPIIVVHSESDEGAKQIAEEFKASTLDCPGLDTNSKWSSGASQVNKRWVLLIRSDEVVTGQLRKTIVEKLKNKEDTPCQYPLPLTMVFLKKRLKYPLDWHDAQPSSLTCLSQNTKTLSKLPKKYASFDGELIRYGEDTLSDCENTVVNKAEERATRLAQNNPGSSLRSLFIRALISSMKGFGEAYFFRKGFKNGFEGIVFAVCDAHTELLGYLRYYELYIREGKVLRDNLPPIKNILVIKLRDIGDNILCTPLIHNLKQALPNASISVLTWSYSKPVFEQNPHIDRLFDLPKDPSSTDIDKLCDELSAMNFDLAMNTHSGGVSSNLLSRITTKHRINNYYRGRNKSFNLITPESDYYRSSIERDLDCMRSLGLESGSTKTEIFLTDDELRWAREELKDKGLNPSNKTVLIHPTAAVPIREWPLEKFSQLAQRLNQQENIQPIVICTDSEYPKIKTLLDDIPGLVILHQMTVRQMMAIIHECDLVIDNDSSPSHVATAFGVPAIVLFSQAIREIFRPYHPVNDQHFVFYNDVDCRECELTHCDDRICLDFSPDEVYTQALKMLSHEED